MVAVIPDTTRLYEVLVRLHDDVRQIQYPYSAKVLKWGIISESEIEQALKENPEASERTVWAGEKPTDVAARLAGSLTRFIDAEGYRAKWVDDGLAEGSWKVFLGQYCMLRADPTPFASEDYHRNEEMENLLTLVKILDEEVFSNPAMQGPTNLKVSFKTKWWKECHRVFSEAIAQEVYHKLQLPERPKDGVCHTPEWTPELRAAIRLIAKRWATSPVWDRPQSTNPETGVDYTSNNEATIKKYLAGNKFTTHYLEDR